MSKACNEGRLALRLWGAVFAIALSCGVFKLAKAAHDSVYEAGITEGKSLQRTFCDSYGQARWDLYVSVAAAIEDIKDPKTKSVCRGALITGEGNSGESN